MTVDVDLGGARSYALKLANRDYDSTMIGRALLRDEAILEIQHRRGVRRAQETAGRVADWAVKHAQANPKEEWKARILTRIVRYREAADLVPWPGRTGPTDRRVLESFYMSATFAQSDKFRYAARTIGGRTGMPWRTASEATRRLLGLKVVRFVGNYGPGLGTKYQLAAPRSWDLSTTDTAYLHDRSSPPAPIVPGLGMRAPSDPLVSVLLKHAAFSTHALGDPGWLLIHWLDPEEPQKSRALSSATGMHYDRTRTVLGKLHHEQLARPVPDGWIRVPDVELLPQLDRYLLKLAGGAHLLLVQERGIQAHEVSRRRDTTSRRREVPGVILRAA
jgi:hypothetical protein